MIQEIPKGTSDWDVQANANFNETEERLQEVEQRPNSNLLINSNFHSDALVNQRGETEYVGGGYTVDMWKMNNAVNVDVKLSVLNDCVKIESTGLGDGAFTDFRQPIEDLLNITGETATLTIDFEAGLGTKFQAYGSTVVTGIQTGDGTRKKYTTTFVAGSDIQNVFTIRLLRKLDNAVGDYIKIYSIKLELGSIATPFVDERYGVKLLKCQRYLKVLKDNNFLSASIFSTTLIRSVLQGFTMRIAPTVEFIGNIENDLVFSAKNAILGTITGVSIPAIDKDETNFLIQFNGVFATGDMGVAGTVSLKNASKIILSAEL